MEDDYGESANAADSFIEIGGVDEYHKIIAELEKHREMLRFGLGDKGLEKIQIFLSCFLQLYTVFTEGLSRL